ncbi:MAG TPA: hypothetical protein VFH29_01110 [Anaerolineales bacterium]|nr:hypothetical protein [Anaerolineales bacterium]
MNLTLVKLVTTPILIGLASLAGRRWGHAISGWIVALPLTTGPIVLFLALSHGPAFAADTATGILTGCFSLVAFTLTYAWLALRWGWLPTLAAASLAFFVMTWLLRFAQWPPVPLWLGALVALLLGLRLFPPPPDAAVVAQELPGVWDIPLRMLIATAFVFAITSLASALGPHLAGLLAPFPLFTATLAAFAQHQAGAGAALSVLRGLLLGLFSFASFMFTLAWLLVPLGIPIAFALALLVVFIFQGVALLRLRGGIR